jgi:hypothetical protein
MHGITTFAALVRVTFPAVKMLYTCKFNNHYCIEWKTLVSVSFCYFLLLLISENILK